MNQQSMEGRVCVITGAASGMGKIAARELAGMGAIVVMNDRELSQGQEARDEIASITGNDSVEFVGCDMIDRAQVSDFAKHVLERYERLDVLINNAGLTNPEFFESKEGYEQHIAIMHLGHWQLTEQLMDRLREGDAGRVIQISSDAHKAGPGIDFDDMRCDNIWKGRRYANMGAFQAYHRAKLAMVYATYEWAERYPAAEVTFNAVSPGYFVGTDVFRHCRGLMKFGVSVFRPLFADPEKSAQTYVYLASSPEVNGVSGKYWEYCKQKDSSPLSHDKELRRKLISWTEQQFT